MKKKIIILGCQGISVNIIKFLKKRRDVEISLVLTYELFYDSFYRYENVYSFCKNNGISVEKFKSFNNDLENKIKNINPDLIISSYFRKIIPEKIFSISKIASINIHPSYLPFYRGPVPTAWSILNNEKYSGATIHLLDKQIDTGDILVQKKIKIYKYETGYELYKRVMKLGFLIFKKNFNLILNKKIKRTKQKKFGSYYGKLNDSNFINWKSKCQDIINLIRVFSYPYNSAKTQIFNKYLLIDKARKFNSSKYLAQTPGKIIKLFKNRIIVSCSDGLISLDKYYFAKPFINSLERKIYLKKGNKFD